MENKVIIGLDEYLDLRDKAEKVDKLGGIVGIGEISGDAVIIIHKTKLDTYINDILQTNHRYDVRIVEGEK